MKVGNVIQVLEKIDPDTPISFMGVEGVIVFVTGTDKDHVIIDESEKHIAEAYCLPGTLQDNPNFGRVILK